MPADPAFNVNALSDPFAGFAYVLNRGGSGYWAWEEDGGAGEVFPAGTPGPTSLERQLLMECVININAWYDDGDGTGIRFHGAGASWNRMDVGGDALVAPVGDAADALLAADPDIDYFTIEPAVELELSHYQLGCPTSYSYTGAPSPTNPPPDWPATSVRESPTMDDDAQVYYSGASTDPADQMDLAVLYGSDWWIDDHWGPDVIGSSSTYPLFAQLGSIAGLEAYLLRPAALTWTDQDASNTADRIFWERVDIPDVITHVTNWTGGHPILQAWIALRGWKLAAPVAAAAAPFICVL
jgi:hypothetical protein